MIAAVLPHVTATTDMTGTYLNYLWVSLAILVVVCGLLWLGWRNRKRRQSHVPAPMEVPEKLLEAEPEAAAEGMVIGTVKATDYLDRIAVHELGLRTEGRIEVHWAPASEQKQHRDDPAAPHGVAIFRAGARNWFIPAQQIQHAGTHHGMIGKFVERDGVIMIGWELGETEVATGFRPRHAAEGRALLEALRRHSPDVPPPGTPSADGGPNSADSPNL